MKKLIFAVFFCMLGIGSVWAQKTFSGKVTEDNGLGLPGVNVLEKANQTNGFATDIDGNWKLTVPNENSILIFRSIGMKTIEVKAKDAKNIVMKTDAALIGEVVVTALGIKRKPKELSYSTTKVGGDDLTKTKAVSVATAMVGKVSGLQINTVNNGVNPNTRVVLRGNRSLLGNNQALIVIDGYPASRDALDRINTSDIENVNVLKGANASALYGSEAANGVLMITTKKGKGKLNVLFSSSVDMQKVAYLPDLQDEFGSGDQDGVFAGLENVNWGPRFTGEMVPASEVYENGDVWMIPFSPIKDRNKDFFDTGFTFRNGIQLSSGDEKGDFLMSVDHANTKGIVPKDKFDRTNFRFKANRNFGKLKLGANVSFYRSHSDVVSKRSGRQNRPFYWTLLNTPLHIPLAEMKNWKDGKYTRNEVSFYRFYENPYFIIDTQREVTDNKDFTIVGDASFDFTDWLSASWKVGYTGTSSTYKNERGAYSYEFKVPKAYFNMEPYEQQTADYLISQSRINSDFLLSFDKKMNEDLNLKVIVGQSLKMTDYEKIRVSGTGLIIPNFFNVSTRKGELNGYVNNLQERKIGVFTDVTLGFKDYLFLNATGRNDWSSTLPKENRSFFYPGVGLSFVATSAMPDLVSDNGLSYLKFSLNYTKTGNNTIPYQTMGTFYSPDNFPYGSVAGLSQSTKEVNPNLGPEFTTSVEGGIEFSFFRSRLSGNITAYKTNTVDQLVPISVSTTSGASQYFTNIGEMENIGLEIDLNGTVIRAGDFEWKAGINYSKINSKVVSLKDGVKELPIDLNMGREQGIDGVSIVAKVGESYPLLKTTAYARDKEGHVIVDSKGDPIKDPKMKVQGKTTPDYVLGFNTKFKYKNFELYAVMDYRTGHVFFNNMADALEFTGFTQHSVSAGRKPFVFPNSVYADGKDGYVKNTNRLTSSGGGSFWKNTYGNIKENYVTDATTLKLREVSLSYSFDEELLGRWGIKALSLGIYGKNLLTFRPAENVYTDPEFGYTTGNAIGVGTQAQTPPTRQFGLNLTVKF